MINLLPLIQQIKIDLIDPQIHYLITCHYMLNEDEIFGGLHFHQGSAFNLTIESGRLFADLLFDQDNLDELSHIEIPFEKIMMIAKGGTASFTAGQIIYTSTNNTIEPETPETDLLYIRHPNPKLHANQTAFLERFSEPEKSEHAQLFRFGNASVLYYTNTDQTGPTEEDYTDWLSGLPDNIRKDMMLKGYERCKSIVSLQRHALERRDMGMSEFMRKLLNDEDFEVWSRSGE